MEHQPITTYSFDHRGIAYLDMVDRENKNIFSDAFIESFVTSLDKVEKASPPVVVVRGLPDVFSGGAEKQTLIDLADGKIRVKDLLISERLVATEFPIIAAMEGHAMGGGLAIALCCDIVIAARESRYGAVFMTMGFTPGMGTTVLLQDLVGPYIAAEMMFTGRRFKGSELEQKGTNINYIVPKSEVSKRARDVALQIAERNIKSVHLLKYALSANKKKKLIEARLQEDMMHRLSFGFPETREIIDDFYGQ